MSDINPRPFAGVVFPNEWDQDNGIPDISSIGAALQVWMMLQPGAERYSVRQVGEVFNLDDAQVRQAVDDHNWMYLDGPDDDPSNQFIEQDGE